MNREADLIWNKDGSIYHLGIRPEELAPTILTVGDPDRVDLVSEHLDQIHLQKHNREFKYVLGRKGNEAIGVLSTGIGTDNIDIVMHELDALAQASHTDDPLTIIRLGTSGSIREDVPLDAILVSEAAIGLDQLMYWYDFQTPEKWMDLTQGLEKLLGFRPHGTVPHAGLLAKCPSHWLKGVTLTANGFYGPQFRPTRTGTRFHDFLIQLQQNKRLRPLTNMEMETAGIYGLSSVLGHRALSVNAILASRLSNSFSKQPENTVQRMIQEVFNHII
jgi:uridine phosphorylase